MRVCVLECSVNLPLQSLDSQIFQTNKESQHSQHIHNTPLDGHKTCSKAPCIHHHSTPGWFDKAKRRHTHTQREREREKEPTVKT